MVAARWRAAIRLMTVRDSIRAEASTRYEWIRYPTV